MASILEVSRLVHQRKELARLEERERVLEQKLAERVRSVVFPLKKAQHAAYQVVDDEWVGRASILADEDMGWRKLCLEEYRSVRDIKGKASHAWTPLWKGKAVGKGLEAVQLQIIETLKALASKYEQCIDAAEVEALSKRHQRQKEQARRRNMCHLPRPPHLPGLVPLVQGWLEEQQEADRERRERARELLKECPPPAAAPPPPVESEAPHELPVEQKSVPRTATRLQEMKEELRRLEEEQENVMRARGDIIGDPLAPLSFGGFSFYLDGQLLRCKWGQDVATLTHRVQYTPETGLVKCGNLMVVLPSEQRAHYLARLTRLITAAGLYNNLPDTEGPVEEPVDTEENPPRSEGPPGLLEYAVRYEPPALCTRGPTTPRRSSVHRGYLAVEVRRAIQGALSFINEVELQLLRRVSREFMQMVDDPDFVARRRGHIMKVLREKCGVRMVELPQGQYCLGRGKEDTGPATYKGVGEGTIDYTEESTYQNNEAVCIAESPITVGQWKKIARHFPHVRHMVSQMDIDLLHYNVIPPAPSRNLRLIERDFVEAPGRWFGTYVRLPAPVDDSEVLELPFPTAARIAGALAGTLPTWQQWECGARGGAGVLHPWGDGRDDDHAVDRLPFGWAVPNPRKGQRADNGYIELADTAVAVHAVHRVSAFPTRRPATAPSPFAHGSIVSVLSQQSSNTTSPPSPRRKRSSLASPTWFRSRGVEDYERYHLHLSPSALCPVRSAPSPDAPILRHLAPGADIYVSNRKGGWLALADGSGWVQQHIDGAGWVRSRSVKITPTPSPRLESPLPSPSPRRSILRKGLLTRGQLELVGANALGQGPLLQSINTIEVHHDDIPSPRLPSPTFAVQRAPAQPVLRGVSRMGKEWNLAQDDCPLVKGGSQHRVVVRSATDLFSKEDIAQHAVALPRPFYTSNHRAFSAPPLYCIAPMPQVLPQEEREHYLTSSIQESLNEGSGAVQVRLQGRGASLTSVDYGTSYPVAPLRCAFRLVFILGGAPQVHPCRPHPRQCPRCTRTYLYEDHCPHCTDACEALFGM